MLVEELKAAIKKERNAVNSGGGDYDRLRALQKEYAAWLVKFCARDFGKDKKLVEVTRPELFLLNKADLPSNVVISCNGYKIWCDGRKTHATKNMITLNDGNMPQYIYGFVF